MSIKDKISSAYAGYIGQSEIVQARIRAHSAFAAGGDSPCNLFVTGEAGLGKSALLERDCVARAVAAEYRFGEPCAPVLLESADEIRRAGDKYDTLIRAITNGCGAVIDEIHEVDNAPTNQTRRLKRILKCLLDDRHDMRHVVLDDETEITLPREKVFFAVGTNFPCKIKDGKAIISRFKRETALQPYTFDEKMAIFTIMLKSCKLRMDERTASLIVKCSRNTIRPMRDIVEYLEQGAIIENKWTVNREEVLTAARVLKLFPYGLNETEVGMLVYISQKGDSHFSDFIVKFGIEREKVKASIHFLSLQNFIRSHEGKIGITANGNKYLNQLAAEKFTLPA